MKPGLISTMALFAFSSGLALAADQPPSGGPREACKADVAKLCAGIQRGGGRIAACLKQNEAQVSAPCKDALAKAREQRAAPAAPKG